MVSERRTRVPGTATEVFAQGAGALADQRVLTVAQIGADFQDEIALRQGIQRLLQRTVAFQHSGQQIEGGFASRIGHAAWAPETAAKSSRMARMATQCDTSPVSHRPPNLIGIGMIERTLGVRIGFFDWMRIGVPITDFICGLYAYGAITTALYHRDRVSGEGQYIDMALLDVQVAMLANMNTNYLASGQAPKRWGNAHPNIVPYQTFNTADGAIILACGNDNLFKKFCEVAGCMEFTTDPKFSTNAARVQNRAEITKLLNAVFAKRPTKEWVKLLDDAGVANGPINMIEDVFKEPQVIARGMKIELPHAVAGKVPLVASPMKFSETPIKHEVPPPVVGQHSDEILRNVLKKTDAQIAQLRSGGIV